MNFRATYTVMGVVALVLLVSGVAIYRYVIQPKIDYVQAQTEINNAARAGDWETALAKHNDLIASEDTPATVRAASIRDVAGLAYRATGDVQHILDSLDALKATVIDPRVAADVRSENISAIAQTFHQSGENPLVYARIFQGQPFQSYRSDTATTTSLRNLYAWSYEVQPSPRNAMGVSSADMLTVLNNPKMPASEKSELLDEAKQYVQHADDLAQASMADARFVNSRRYAGYLFWRAFTIGALALESGAPYTTQYRDVYKDTIAKIKAQHSDQSAVYLPIAHWHFAVFLHTIDADDATAKDEMKQATALITDNNQDLLNMIRNKRSGVISPDDFLGNAIVDMMHLSTEFEAFASTVQ